MAIKCEEEFDLLSENPMAELSLVSIPRDIQIKVCSFLSTSDVESLSCLNRRYREVFKWILFRRIRTTWTRLMEDEGFLAQYRNCIKELRLVDNYQYGEWHVDLGKLLEPLENLSCLYINTSSSSSWLKYRSNDIVRELTLYFHQGHNYEDREFVQLKYPRFFSAGDVIGFSRLSKLCLSDFHFNWELSDVPFEFQLNHLCMNNCTWNYPFELSLFNANHSIKKLEILYSSKNAFVISERLNHFYLGNEEAFNELKSLTFEIYAERSLEGKTWGKNLLPSILLRYINRERFPSLSYLSFHGFHMTTESFVGIFTHIDKSKPHIDTLKMLLVSVGDRGLVKRIREQCTGEYSFIKFNLKIDES